MFIVLCAIGISKGLADADLVAHWSFDDGTAREPIGGYDGTINGATPAAGRVSGALNFDGIDDYIDLSTIDPQAGGSEFSITALIRADTFPADDGRIISKAAGSATADHLFMLSLYDTPSGKNVIRLRLRTNGTTDVIRDTATDGIQFELSADRWYYICATYDGQFQRLYVNTVQVETMSKTGTIDSDTDMEVRIGANPGERAFFDGVIDEVMLFDHALTQSEINTLLPFPIVASRWQWTNSSGTPTLPDHYVIEREFDTDSDGNPDSIVTGPVVGYMRGDITEVVITSIETETYRLRVRATDSAETVFSEWSDRSSWHTVTIEEKAPPTRPTVIEVKIRQ